MSKKDTISGLDILTYLRDNHVTVDDKLCDVVPESATSEAKSTKTDYIVGLLLDDEEGKLAHHFPDFYNRFPEITQPQQIQELKRSFRLFVRRIILGEKRGTTYSAYQKKESTPDILGEKIETLISETRGEWLHWPIKDGHLKILANMKELLPLLKQRYHNPMLQSEANMATDEGEDIIPDEYVSFLYDILIMLCTVYNTKVHILREYPSLWAENGELVDDIHFVASFLFYRLAWTTFDTIIPENNNSISYLARALISGINTLYYAWKEETKMRAKIPKKPPEKE